MKTNLQPISVPGHRELQPTAIFCILQCMSICEKEIVTLCDLYKELAQGFVVYFGLYFASFCTYGIASSSAIISPI